MDFARILVGRIVGTDFMSVRVRTQGKESGKFTIMSKNGPTVDLGYPTEPRGRILSFNSIEEEAAFGDTHDSTEFDEELKPAELTVGPDVSGQSDLEGQEE